MAGAEEMASASDKSDAALFQIPLATPSGTEVPAKASSNEIDNDSEESKKFPCVMSYKTDRSLLLV